MEIKDSIASSALRKRKLESIAEKWACKHVKLGPQASAPDCLAAQPYLNWLSKVLLNPDLDFIKKSGMPSRLMYLNRGHWEVYTTDIATALLACLVAHEKTARFSFSGQMYVVDFAHMVQLNLQTGYVRSIAWIDDSGKCFAPTRLFEGSSYGFLLFLHPTTQQPMPTNFPQLNGRLSTLASDEGEFLTIKEKFTSAMGSLAKFTCIVGIHRCTFEGTSAQARLETFQMQEQAVGAIRGNANVRYAWHGTSKKGVVGIMSYGFGQPGIPKHGRKYGSGVYLAPESKSFLSAIYSDVDEDGAQHMLLCKVILGEMEQVPEGCKQFSPSSEDHDSGADDVASPSRYIVWSTHMNTHILPLFVVSFKLMPSLQSLLMSRKRREEGPILDGLCCPPSSNVQDGEEAFDASYEANQDGVMDNSPLVGLRKAPQSPWISFSELFLQMGKKLSPPALMTLRHLHSEFQVGRLPRKSLVRLTRAMAGDSNLWHCIIGKKLDSQSDPFGGEVGGNNT